MGLQNVCDSLVGETDGLLACIVLDLETGLTLATSCREGIDAAAASTVARHLGGLFRSKSLTLTTPKHAEGLVREAQVTSRNTYHFMATLPGWSSALLVFVTERVVSIGLGWMAVHQALDRVVQARPGSATTEMPPEPRNAPPAAREPGTAPPTTATSWTPAPAAPSDRPEPSVARPGPLGGEGPAATSSASSPRQAIPPAAKTPQRQGTAPAAPARQALPPATQPAPRRDSDEPALGSRRLRESPEAAPAVGNAEPPTLAVPGSRAQRTGRQTPAVRPRAPSAIPAAGKDRVQPPDDEEEPKADVGRMGARAVFGTKARRS